MDFWSVLMFFFLAFLIMSCCGYCCSTKRRGAVLSTPVVVTSATHTAPGGYPVTQIPPGGGYPQTTVYAAPYPTANTGAPGQMPMPMPMPNAQHHMPGVQQYMAPYPPMPGASNMNPPSYETVVGGNQPNVYEKQAPYNPSYPTH